MSVNLSFEEWIKVRRKEGEYLNIIFEYKPRKLIHVIQAPWPQ
jgi:hypothetical protein